jgi:hypothetical protein
MKTERDANLTCLKVDLNKNMKAGKYSCPALKYTTRSLKQKFVCEASHEEYFNSFISDTAVKWGIFSH